MSDIEILVRAIKKAKASGFTMYFSQRELIYKPILQKKIPVIRGCYAIIFSHSFAIAFWGEVDCGTWTHDENGDEIYIPAWEYQLEKMVLEAEPLKYLEQFLK